MSSGESHATAVAHPNIALVKYWGKAAVEDNLPAVGSLSITLGGLSTTTTVRFDPALEHDRFFLSGREDPTMGHRVSACLDRLRARLGSGLHAVIESENDFPTAAGLASSASGFAALVTAADAALRGNLPPEDRADLARQCSGSAARSVFGGFVELRLTPGGPRPTETSQLLPPEAWPLEVLVAVTSTGPKETGSTEGMLRTERTSPYYRAWVESSPADLAGARAAVVARDFEALAEISEASCLKMHGLMLSARPGLLYWNGTTLECLHRIRKLRRSGVPVFFTVDAGPQVKAVCLPEGVERVRAELAAVPGVLRILETGLGEGARVLR
ncbi:MAG: diphosphomevalonate decarboxylase [Acidobacteria bacterium]|nr:diphosphomevalonate decarboxylase [Acidobacteriota bacterium]